MKEYKDCPDEELIARLRSGEKEIEDFLLGKYKDLVRKKARARFLIGGDTDDLIQEGMIGLFKAIRDYRDDREASFRTFAGLCIDRQMANAIEGSTRQKHQMLNTAVSLNKDQEENEKHLGWAVSPEELLIDRENMEAMMEEITRSLSTMENKVLALYLAGNSYAAIAGSLGKTPKSVENALRRIRTKIRQMRET